MASTSSPSRVMEITGSVLGMSGRSPNSLPIGALRCEKAAPITQKGPRANREPFLARVAQEARFPPSASYFPALTSSSAISRSLNFCTFMEGVMGKSSTKNTRLGTL